MRPVIAVGRIARIVLRDTSVERRGCRHQGRERVGRWSNSRSRWGEEWHRRWRRRDTAIAICGR